MENETVEISVDVIRHTRHAILVSDGETSVWLPLSQVHNKEDVLYATKELNMPFATIEIPEWLAREKGLI